MRGRRAITRVSEGWLRVPGFPLTAERPLYSELVDTTLASDTRIRTAPTQYLYYSTIIQEEYAAWKLQTPIKKNSKLNFGG